MAHDLVNAPPFFGWVVKSPKDPGGPEVEDGDEGGSNDDTNNVFHSTVEAQVPE